MTAARDTDRILTAWFEADAPPRAPGSLADEVIARVARTPRKPAWRILERWLPMEATTRLIPVPRPAAVVVLAALLLALLGLAIYAGTSHPVPAPFGIAKPGLIAYTQNNQVVVSNLDGSDARTLSSHQSIDSNPTWSRDGTRLAFFSDPTSAGPAELVVISPDGSNRRIIVDGLPIDSGGTSLVAGPYWAPDGSAIAYAPIQGGREEIDVVSLAGGQPRTVVASAPLGANPAWSPDGRTLAYCDAQPAEAVYLVAADGSGGSRKLSAGIPGACPDIAWSPDGRRLAYRAGSGDGADGEIRIYLIDVAGTHEGRLTKSSVVEMYPLWSPTGDRIVFGQRAASDPNGAPLFQLVVADPDTGHLVDVRAPQLFGYAAWSWSPDGTRLFVEGDSDYLLDPTGATTAITVARWGDWQRLAP